MGRERMVEYREKLGLDIYEMARLCKCSHGLLRGVEEDERFVTHPNIVSRIARRYQLTKSEWLSIIPECRRIDYLHAKHISEVKTE